MTLFHISGAYGFVQQEAEVCLLLTVDPLFNSAPSPPCGMLPTRRYAASALCSTYSSSLKSHAFGLDFPSLRIPEPLEIWITCLGAMVPFKDRVVCITSDDTAHSKRVAARASDHFGNVLHVPAPDSVSVLRSLRSIPEGSSDAVVFCDNSFSHFVSDAPEVITAAHNALRPQGVLCVWGHHAPAIVAPPHARDAFSQYTKLLDALCPIDPTLHVDSSCISLSTSRRLASTSASHDDTYFPFPSVAKRLFESELVLEPSEVVGVFRDCPRYTSVMTPLTASGDACGYSRRLRVRGDPLNDLAGMCYNATKGMGGVSVSVKHFVITCDSRPINRGNGQRMLLGGRRGSQRKLASVDSNAKLGP